MGEILAVEYEYLLFQCQKRCFKYHNCVPQEKLFFH